MANTSPLRHRSGPVTKILLVAWREFKYTALTKTFLFFTVILPVIMVGVIALSSALFKESMPAISGTLIVLDPSGLVTEEATKEFARARDEAGRPIDPTEAATNAAQNAKRGDSDPAALAALAGVGARITVTVQGETDPAREADLKAKLSRREIVGLAVVDPKLLTAHPGNTRLPVLVPDGTSPMHTDLFRRTLQTATVKARVRSVGQDFSQLTALMARPDVRTESVSETGKTAGEHGEFKRFLLPIAFFMLLWIPVFGSANQLLTTTIEEKSNKVMEVLLSAVSPMQLLTGKILGQALVGLVIVVVYGGLGAGALIVFALANLVPPILLVQFVIFYVMAFFMVAALLAAVGSAVNELREAQGLVAPVSLVLMVPWILWMPISQNPNGPLATIMSFVPPMTPFVMMLRLSSSNEPIPLWQLISTILFGYAAMVGMIWLAARIFRVGVLMQGKPPNPLELLKWAMYK